MKFALILAWFTIPLAAQTLNLACGSNPRAGTNESCTVSLASGSSPAGLEFQFTTSLTVGTIVQAVTGTASTAGKSIYCNNANGLCLIVGQNQTTIADGNVAALTIPLPATLGNQTITFTVTATEGASLAGSGIPFSSGLPVSVSVLSTCDLNGDGVVNAADVTLAINNVLAVPQVVTDLNKDGKTDDVDVQIVINAAQGKGCTAQ